MKILSQKEKIDISQLAYYFVASGKTKESFCESACRVFGCDYDLNFYNYLENEFKIQKQVYESSNF